MKDTYFIIAYDISEKNRLQRLQRLISNQFLQLQYSVYYGSMTCKRMDAFITSMQKIIHPNEDDLRIYEVEPLEHSFVIGKRDDEIMLFSDIGEITL